MVTTDMVAHSFRTTQSCALGLR